MVGRGFTSPSLEVSQVLRSRLTSTLRKNKGLGAADGAPQFVNEMAMASPVSLSDMMGPLGSSMLGFRWVTRCQPKIQRQDRNPTIFS